MSRRFPPEGKVTSIRGRNGACDVVLTVAVPHGKKTRDVEVPLEPEFILALAKAIDCCPDHILETHRTGKRGPGPGATYVNLGHAVWHLEHPDMPRPCLPSGGMVIDILDETKLPPGREESPGGGTTCSNCGSSLHANCCAQCGAHIERGRRFCDSTCEDRQARQDKSSAAMERVLQKQGKII